MAPQSGQSGQADEEQASEAASATVPAKPRGRKRTRTTATPAPPTSSLVMSRRNPDARSPTPPTRVVKSTYGGNLFTHEDIDYLKSYIVYCQEQGLVLSLREICERVAVKVRLQNRHTRRYLTDVRSGSPPHVSIRLLAKWRVLTIDFTADSTHGVGTVTSTKFVWADTPWALIAPALRMNSLKEVPTTILKRL